MGIKKIGLLGGRGFVGQEILLLLEQHEQIEVVSIFSSSQSGQPVNSNAARSLIYQDLKIDSLNLSDEDGFIIALPNNESKPYIDLILKHNPNTIFVDISSDHRFDSDWEYRIPELSGPVSSTRISNPGCYSLKPYYYFHTQCDVIILCLTLGLNVSTQNGGVVHISAKHEN